MSPATPKAAVNTEIAISSTLTTSFNKLKNFFNKTKKENNESIDSKNYINKFSSKDKKTNKKENTLIITPIKICLQKADKNQDQTAKTNNSCQKAYFKSTVNRAKTAKNLNSLTIENQASLLSNTQSLPRLNYKAQKTTQIFPNTDSDTRTVEGLSKKSRSRYALSDTNLNPICTDYSHKTKKTCLNTRCDHIFLMNDLESIKISNKPSSFIEKQKACTFAIRKKNQPNAQLPERIYSSRFYAQHNSEVTKISLPTKDSDLRSLVCTNLTKTISNSITTKDQISTQDHKNSCNLYTNLRPHGNLLSNEASTKLEKFESKNKDTNNPLNPRYTNVLSNYTKNNSLKACQYRTSNSTSSIHTRKKIKPSNADAKAQTFKTGPPEDLTIVKSTPIVSCTGDKKSKIDKPLTPIKSRYNLFKKGDTFSLSSIQINVKKRTPERVVRKTDFDLALPQTEETKINLPSSYQILMRQVDNIMEAQARYQNHKPILKYSIDEILASKPVDNNMAEVFKFRKELGLPGDPSNRSKNNPVYKNLFDKDQNKQFWSIAHSILTIVEKIIIENPVHDTLNFYLSLLTTKSNIIRGLKHGDLQPRFFSRKFFSLNKNFTSIHKKMNNNDAIINALKSIISSLKKPQNDASKLENPQSLPAPRHNQPSNPSSERGNMLLESLRRERITKKYVVVEIQLKNDIRNIKDVRLILHSGCRIDSRAISIIAKNEPRKFTALICEESIISYMSSQANNDIIRIRPWGLDELRMRGFNLAIICSAALSQRGIRKPKKEHLNNIIVIIENQDWPAHAALIITTETPAGFG